ncbi:MAG TPA: hypothetical protein VIL73_09070 [Gaiellaceae bacterium]
MLNGGTVGEADAVWLDSYMVIVPQFSTHNFVRFQRGVYPPKELTRSSDAVSVSRSARARDLAEAHGIVGIEPLCMGQRARKSWPGTAGRLDRNVTRTSV